MGRGLPRFVAFRRIESCKFSEKTAVGSADLTSLRGLEVRGLLDVGCAEGGGVRGPSGIADNSGPTPGGLRRR